MYRSTSIVVRTLLVGLFLSSAALARVTYVDDDAVGANDGSSWENAFSRLQQALAGAGLGDEIRVAQGVYRPDPGDSSPQPPARRSVGVAPANASDGLYPAFPLQNGMTLRGGFAGLGAADPDARDVQRYETVLTGDIKGNDRGEWGPWHPLSRFLQSDNSLHLVTSTGTDTTAVLDGFTITAATDSAILNDDGSPRIVDCTFRRNVGQPGGGLRSEGGHPSLSRCTFDENSSWTDGGAVSARNGSVTLTECRFALNVATNAGGGIQSRECIVFLADCSFGENGADTGGAASHDRGSLDLAGCRFERNVARAGGAVFLNDSWSAALTDCVFCANWAADTGGAVYAHSTSFAPDSSMTLAGCTFAGNTADRGGGVYLTGSYHPRQTVAVGHCLFTGNRAETAGGVIYGVSSLVNLVNCTFADNWAASWATLDWRGSRWLPGDAPAVVLANCIVWDGGESIFRTFRRWDGQPVDSNEVVTITYSDVQGGWPGAGNIDANPLFAGPGYWVSADTPSLVVETGHADALWIEGDYPLKSQSGRWDQAGESWVLDDVTSPCIDAGDPASPVGDEPEPNGGRINIGAYGGTTQASRAYPGGS